MKVCVFKEVFDGYVDSSRMPSVLAETPHLPEADLSFEEEQCLDMEIVIKHFQSTAKVDGTTGSPRRGCSFAFISGRPFPSSFPRFTFYSEQTGVVRSSFWSSLDISLNGTGTDVKELLSTPFWIDVTC